ncbi:MAG: flagellar biosynthetic protein FliR [Aquabacterium sp.]
MEVLLVWVQATFLASVRLGVGLGMTPLFGAFGVPMLARLILVLVLSGLAAQVHAPGALAFQASGAHIGVAIGNELAVGLLLSLGVHAAFAAFSVAGRMVDAQLGFTLGAVLDPVSKGHAAVMASGLNLLAVLLFFLSDVHHQLIAAYFETFELLPIGGGISTAGWVPVAQGAGSMFSLGFVIAAPVVVALLLADVVVAVVSRNLPQMNVMFLSIPLKVMLGVAVMAVSLKFMSPVIHKTLMLPLTLLDKVQ